MQYGSIAKIVGGISVTLFAVGAFADPVTAILKNKSSFHIAALFLQPNSNNLKYAVFVSGLQPLHQSWHNQEINPHFTPGFELGYTYAMPQSPYNVSIDWLYLNSTTSSSKQASESTALSTVEFVAPPYDVGPAVFGIKRADSKVNYNFNNITVNVGRLFTWNPNVTIRLFGGVNILRIDQTLTTTFSDYAGSPPIPSQAYGLPADPNFYFKTQNTSRYTGAGPDLGVNIQYEAMNGFGVIGQFATAITAGSMQTNDNFTSASTRLLAQGITTSHQAITAPNSVEVVPGLDSKVGLFFNHAWGRNVDLTIEAGYRFAYYMNAISEVMPDTLVQPGTVSTIPEFATGTMAINSTIASHSPFRLNGPYINVTINYL